MQRLRHTHTAMILVSTAIFVYSPRTPKLGFSLATDTRSTISHIMRRLEYLQTMDMEFSDGNLATSSVSSTESSPEGCPSRSTDKTVSQKKNTSSYSKTRRNTWRSMSYSSSREEWAESKRYSRMAPRWTVRTAATSMTRMTLTRAVRWSTWANLSNDRKFHLPQHRKTL